MRGLFSPKPQAATPQAAPGTAVASCRAKRDRLRSDLDEATAEGERLLGTKSSTEADLRRAVEDGNSADRGQLVARLGEVNAAIAANRTLASVTEGALAAAEASLAAALTAEKIRRRAEAIEETERELIAAKEAIGPAFVPFAEARGRARDLRERLERLRAEQRAEGGAVRSNFHDAPLPDDVQLASAALAAKHEGHIDSGGRCDNFFGCTVVRGLAGPEPEIEP